MSSKKFWFDLGERAAKSALQGAGVGFVGAQAAPGQIPVATGVLVAAALMGAVSAVMSLFSKGFGDGEDASIAPLRKAELQDAAKAFEVAEEMAAPPGGVWVHDDPAPAPAVVAPVVEYSPAAPPPFMAPPVEIVTYPDDDGVDRDGEPVAPPWEVR